LTCQSLVAYVLNAVVIGSVFVRLTRPEKRANTILFSPNAVIREINGALYFMFQVVEAKTHDLLEASVRCYCIRHDRKGEQTYQTFPMRLQHPDDDLGGKLMLTLPTKVVHRIDNWSPLCPSSTGRRKRKPGRPHSSPTTLQPSSSCCRWPEAPQRQVDCDQGRRDLCICPTCGSSFQSLEQLRRHVKHLAPQDDLAELPLELRHRAFSEEDMRTWGWTLAPEKEESDSDENSDVDVGLGHRRAEGWTPGAASRKKRPPQPFEAQLHGWAAASAEPGRGEVQEFLSERYVEVVVLVEGTEPVTSLCCQARHSYLFPLDVVWDRDFAECMLDGVKGSACSVDLTRFQELVPAPPTAAPPLTVERRVPQCGTSSTSAPVDGQDSPEGTPCVAARSCSFVHSPRLSL